MGRQGLTHVRNHTDGQGRPAGGVVVGTGITISWQDGPLGRGEDRRAPNGAFVEDVLLAVHQRLEHYQTVAGGRFACVENERAMEHIRSALAHLDGRTRDRERREVEGTHAP